MGLGGCRPGKNTRYVVWYSSTRKSLDKLNSLVQHVYDQVHLLCQLLYMPLALTYHSYL